MVLSMTGYGKAEGTHANKKLTVEIRSLNSKQLDLNLRMPSLYKEKELELRSYLAEKVNRGKVDVSIYYESQGEEKRLSINKELMKAYHNDMKDVADSIGQPDADYMTMLMRIPDVMVSERQELNKEEWAAIRELVDQALEGFQGYRGQEGDQLHTDFSGRINSILRLQQESEAPISARMDKVRDRIKNNMNELVDPDKIDPNRFEQEVIYYLEKMDISEERVRLKGNCDYFLEILNEEKSQGKKLGFIAQEIGREINTMGSKANDADVQRIVVQMKDELEKIKEQVLNAL